MVDLVRQDARYRGHAEQWAKIIQQVKQLVLSESEPSEIAATIRHEVDRLEGN